MTALCFICRASVPGWIRHGSHWSRWHLPGNFSQRWRAAGGWEEEHPQTAGWSIFFRKNLQAEWVSHYFFSIKNWSLPLSQSLWLHWSLVSLLPRRDMACSVAGITSDANVLTNELRLIAQRWAVCAVVTSVLKTLPVQREVHWVWMWRPVVFL